MRHLERSAFAREALAVKLLVHHAAGGRHPLHVARPDRAVIAGRVAMFELALIDDRNGLESAVRMLAHAGPRGRRRELVGSGVVQQQERVELLTFLIGEQAADRKTVADPMRPDVANDVSNRFHGSDPRGQVSSCIA